MRGDIKMNHLDICKRAVQLALQKGATDAACSIGTNEKTEISVNKGQSEGLSASTSVSMGIKVFLGQKVASFAVNDLSDESVTESVETALMLAKGSPENKFEGLADKSLVGTVSAQEVAMIDAVDKTKPFTPEQMLQMAIDMEEAAYAVPSVGAVRSSDVRQGRDVSYTYLSNGFEGVEEDTWYQLMIDPVAGTGDKKVTSYDYSVAFHQADLDSVQTVGKTAGEKATAMLNQVKLPQSGKMPVVFSPEISSSLMKGCLKASLNGSAIYAEKSFMDKSSIGQKLFGSNVTLVDDRLKARGLSSSAFSDSGIIGPQSVKFVEDGVVQNFTMGVVTARKLGMSPDLGRSSMHNSYFEPSDVSVKDMLSDIKLGLYVTGTMGRGFTSENGNVSYTVEGYLIRDGFLTGEFVLEATIAGNLVEMLNSATFANDLTDRNGLNSSTTRVDSLTVS